MRAEINKITPANLAENKFRKAKAIKRNKKIFDIDLIDAMETQDSMYRRIPLISPSN